MYWCVLYFSLGQFVFLTAALKSSAQVDIDVCVCVLLRMKRASSLNFLNKSTEETTQVT